MPDTLILMFVFIAISIFVTGIIIWNVGITSQERMFVKAAINNKFKQYKK